MLKIKPSPWFAAAEAALLATALLAAFGPVPGPSAPSPRPGGAGTVATPGGGAAPTASTQARPGVAADATAGGGRGVQVPGAG